MNNGKIVMSKTPLRITFVGGGTDLPIFYRTNGFGAVVSATINKYVYVVVHSRFTPDIRVSYSITEVVDKVEDIKHPTVREALKFLGITGGIEIISLSDIPSEGTGLGSSSSFLVGLLNALHEWKGERTTPKQLAEEAVMIEREILREPGGKQDQYAAAFGGINYMEFFSDETVSVFPVVMSNEKIKDFNEHFAFYYTGKHRKSLDILKQQISESKDNSGFYRHMRELAFTLYNELSKGNFASTGTLMHENWILKKQLTSVISDNATDSLYKSALQSGAEGGKLVGAGGGGFLLFYADKIYHKKISGALGLRIEPFTFDFEGSRIIYIG